MHCRRPPCLGGGARAPQTSHRARLCARLARGCRARRSCFVSARSILVRSLRIRLSTSCNTAAPLVCVPCAPPAALPARLRPHALSGRRRAVRARRAGVVSPARAARGVGRRTLRLGDGDSTVRLGPPAQPSYPRAGARRRVHRRRRRHVALPPGFAANRPPGRPARRHHPYPRPAPAAATRDVHGGGNDDARDPLAETPLALAGITSAAVQGRSALGPRAGARVLRIGRVPGAPWVTTAGRAQAHLDGFDLHANVAVAATNRDGLEQLARYVLESFPRRGSAPVPIPKQVVPARSNPYHDHAARGHTGWPVRARRVTPSSTTRRQVPTSA